MTGLRAPIISLAALVVLVAAMASLGLLRNPDAPTGPGVYSRSAIGHAGILKLLQLHGVAASASEGASADKVRHGGLLVLAEPAPLTDPAELRLLLSAPRVLLVLPKWSGLADPDQPGWIGAASLLPVIAPMSVLQDAFPRDFGQRAIRYVEGGPGWPHDALGVTPSFDSAVQLLTGTSLDAVVEGPGGILVGQKVRPGNIVYVLADPDAVSNHGLAEGNAAFALALLDRARAGGPVVFDETIHGFRTVPRRRWLAIFSRPFAAVTFSLLMSASLLAWADGRFGAALPRPGLVPQGQLALIGAIAGLLDRAGHRGPVLARYVRGTVQDVSAGLPPVRGDGDTLLAEAELRRGVTVRAADLLREAAGLEAARRAPAEAVAALAQRAHAWKQEMVHGAAGYPRDG